MISAAFGGDISVESEVGKGSRFTFYFELKNIDAMISSDDENEISESQIQNSLSFQEISEESIQTEKLLTSKTLNMETQNDQLFQEINFLK